MSLPHWYCNFSCNFSSKIQVKSSFNWKKCDTLFSLYSTDLVKNMHLVTYILLTSWLFSLSGKCSLIFPSSPFLNFLKLPPLGSHLKEPSSIVWLFWRSFLQRWFFFQFFLFYIYNLVVLVVKWSRCNQIVGLFLSLDWLNRETFNRT